MMVKEEASQQFFKNAVFQVLAKELWRRYYLKGEFGVSIGMTLFEKVDAEPLRRLLGITVLNWSKKKRVKIIDFAMALESSRVAWTLTDFVRVVLKKELVLKTDKEARENVAFQLFLDELKQIDILFVELLTEKQLRDWFHSESGGFSDFVKVSHGLKNMPSDYTRMPVFAYQQTGDAHAFDESQPAGRLLLQMLAKISKETPIIPQRLAATEEKNSVLNEFYLLRDDILNFVAIRGLVAKKAGVVNEMWNQASIESCSWNVPLKEVLRMDSIYPNRGNKVLIVENSGVYSILVDLLPTVPIICSSGQFTYAVWQVLRKLVESGTELYYSGDMDPEGLLMAQRVFEMFPENAHTIGMDLKNYQESAMINKISAERLKQLRQIKDSELKLVADRMEKTHQIALQEGFLEQLMNDVKRIFDPFQIKN